MASALEFKPVLATVSQSQDHEVVLNKQAVFAEHARDIRAAVNQLPTELTKEIMSTYSEPTPAIIAKITNAITAREFSIENVAAEKGVDLDWFTKGGAPSQQGINESQAASYDEWNEPTP